MGWINTPQAPGHRPGRGLDLHVGVLDQEVLRALVGDAREGRAHLRRHREPGQRLEGHGGHGVEGEDRALDHLVALGTVGREVTGGVVGRVDRQPEAPLLQPEVAGEARVGQHTEGGVRLDRISEGRALGRGGADDGVAGHGRAVAALVAPVVGAAVDPQRGDVHPVAPEQGQPCGVVVDGRGVVGVAHEDALARHAGADQRDGEAASEGRGGEQGGNRRHQRT